MLSSSARLVLAAALVLVGALGSGAVAGEGVEEGLGELLEAIPAADRSEAERIAEGLVALGDEGAAALVGRLVPPGTGDDTRERYALYGVATHVARPGADAERRRFAEAVAGHLRGDADVQVKGFLVRLLQVAGGREAVDALGGVLLEADLCEYAAQALVATGDERAAEVIRGALGKAEGPARVTLVQSLGTLRDRKAVGDLERLADKGDAAVRRAAVDALAAIGDPGAMKTLLRAADAADPHDRARGTAALVVFAERLLERDKEKDATEVYERLWETRTEGAERHVRAAALRGLARARGAKALDSLVEAMESDDVQIRAVAIETAIAMPGRSVTEWWIGRMKGGGPAVRERILGVLARRGDAAAAPAVLEAMDDEDAAVRLAAIRAAGAFGGRDVVEALVGCLGEGEADQAARAALVRVPGEEANDHLAAALAKAEAAAVRTAILDLLAARGARSEVGAVVAATGDADPAVRLAAIQAYGALAGAKDVPRLIDLVASTTAAADREAAEQGLKAVCGRLGADACADVLVGSLAKAEAPTAAALLRVLGRVGGMKALAAVRDATRHADPDVRDAAVRALAGWTDTKAMADLLDIARDADNPIYQVLALRGYVGLAGKAGAGAEDTLEMYRRAMDAAKRPEEKKLVLSAIAGVASRKALDAALGYLDDASLREEAAAAAVRICAGISNSYPDLVKETLGRVMATAGSKQTKKGAEEVLRQIKRDESFITAWLVAGPFREKDKAGPQLFDVAFPPEAPGAEVEWKPVGGMSAVIDLNQAVGGSHCAAYLRTCIHVPEERAARLEIGSDDGVKVWLNGELVHANNAQRGVTPGEDKAEIRLRKGWNTLLVKVTQGVGGWGVCAMIAAPDGSPFEDMRTSVSESGEGGGAR